LPKANKISKEEQSDSPEENRRVIVDTNVFVASLFGRASRQVVGLWETGQMLLLVSDPILNEYYEILSRFRFRRQLKSLLALFDRRFNMEVVAVRGKSRLVPGDAEDDKFLHCAEQGRAAAIVSGDEHILALKAFYEEVPIRTASEFLLEIWPRLQKDVF